jgi:hypothetical protein
MEQFGMPASDEEVAMMRSLIMDKSTHYLPGEEPPPLPANSKQRAKARRKARQRQ